MNSKCLVFPDSVLNISDLTREYDACDLDLQDKFMLLWHGTSEPVSIAERDGLYFI